MVSPAPSSLSCVLQRPQGRLNCIPVKHSRHREDHLVLRQQPAMLRCKGAPVKCLLSWE
jgi:hypothetical protein